MKKLSRKLLLGICLSVAATSLASAQQGSSGAGADGMWSLEEALNYARQNNLQARQNDLNVNLSRTELRQSQFSRLPTLNGSGNYSANAGSFQDPVTFSLSTQSAQTANLSLNASLPLFAGFQTINSIKQGNLAVEASQQEYLSILNDISIQIVTSYLNILFANELMATSDLQRNLTTQQLNRTQILLKAGSVAESAVFDLQSQLATDELNFITAQNQRDIARLSLMQLLNLPQEDDFQIEIPEIPEPDQLPAPINGRQVYDIALQTLPAIKAADLRLRSAEKGVDVARGAYYPRISLFAGFNSRYSSVSEFLYGGETINLGFLRQDYYADGTGTQLSRSIYTPRTVFEPVYGDYPFFDQLQDNINRNVGVSLQVPILNGLQARTNVERAKLQQQNAKLTADIARNNLRQTIEQASVDALAAQRRYVAAKQQVTAAEQNFRNAELRLNNGVINTVDFNVIANTFRSAQSSLIQAKYDYTFKLKVLDFYQGKELSF